MKFKNIIRFIAIILLVSLAFAVIVSWVTPAKAYESSIYSATPSIFWVVIIFSVFCGIILVIWQIYSRRHGNDNLWNIGLTLLFAGYIAILSLWIIRGYPFWCSADPLTHLGNIYDTIATGFIEKSNIYPITYVYLAQFAEILNVNLLTLSKLVPLLFAILNILLVYVFARSILPQKEQAILATIVSMSFLQGWYLNLTPNHLANLFFPLALFLVVKSSSPNSLQWKFLFVLTIVLYPIFHLVPGIALILALSSLSLFGWIKRTFNKQQEKANISILKPNPTALALLIIWTITWISSFYVWDATIINIDTIISEGDTTQLDLLVEQLGYGMSYTYNLVSIFLKLYGGVVLLLFLALIALPILWKKITSETPFKNLSAWYGPLAAFSLITALLYFLNLSFSPLRFVVYMVIPCTVFAGFVLYEMLVNWRLRPRNVLKPIAPLLVLFILIVLFLNGALKLYPSRYVLEANMQITKSEIDGMDWFLDTKDTIKDFTALTISPGRFAGFLLTPEERIGRQDLKRLSRGLYIREELKLPFHFGYDMQSSLGYSYSDDVYLALNTKDRLIYQEVFPEMAETRFLFKDFQSLENDISVAKLYSNGGFDIYYIFGVKARYTAYQ